MIDYKQLAEQTRKSLSTVYTSEHHVAHLMTALANTIAEESRDVLSYEDMMTLMEGISNDPEWAAVIRKHVQGVMK